MPILLILIEVFIGTLAVWVLSLEVALYGRVSINNLGSGFLAIWILLLAVMAKPWWRRVRAVGPREARFARNVFAMGCLVGLLVLVASRPDADDIGYFYQPMVDAAKPSEPFTVDPFYVPFKGKRVEFPFLAENEAWEAMVVTVAQWVNIDPLVAYHNIFAFLATILWTITYALLFRRFRVPRDRVWMALLATVLFLMLDGNLHRSFGNFTLLRIWQGKIVAWSILPPVFLLFALRYFAAPSRYKFGLLFLVGSLSFFVSRSTLFLFVVLGTSYTVAYFLSFWGNNRRSQRATTALLVVTPLWVLGAGLVLTLIPADISLSSIYAENAGSGKQFGTSWWTSLRNTVIGNPLTLARDFLFLVVLPFFAVPRPLNRWLPLVSLTIAVLALSPLTGPLWYYFFANVYWRFYYALPLPLCVGLTVLLASSSARPKLGFARRIVLATILLVVTGINIQKPALSAANGVEFKWPLGYRFHAEILRYTTEMAPQLKGKTVLAPREVAMVLGMTQYNTVELPYVRSIPEGSNKMQASRALKRCAFNRKTSASIQTLIDQGADAIIMAACEKKNVERLRSFLISYDLIEGEYASTHAYRLFDVLPKIPREKLLSPRPHTSSPADGHDRALLPQRR